MKLRNKKTGYVGNFDIECIEKRGGLVKVVANDVPYYEVKTECGNLYYYNTLAEFNDEWGEYSAKEPLITDEMIREAVQAWALANKYDKLWVYHDHTAISFYNEDDGDNEITFNTVQKFGLEHLKCYTITELCGDEQ